MSDVVYSVEVNFLQNGSFSAPAAGLADLHAKTDKWVKSLYGGASGFAREFNGALDAVGGAFLDLGAKAAAGLAGALTVGMGAAVKMAFDFNEQMETTQISLAAIANANGLVVSMQGGMRVSSDIIKDMRADAARLPGEFKDLENIMTTIASAGGQMGVGMAPMEKLAAKTMTAAAVLSVPQPVAAREMAMMLEGNARHSMPFFNRLGMGMGTKEFNALAPTARLEKIREALSRLDPAVEHFTNSWLGIKTTAIDAIRQGVGAIGGPLFQSVKEIVKAFNIRALSKTDDLRNIGQVVGDGLNNAFLFAVQAVKHWYPIVETFAENLYNGLHRAFTKVSPLITKLLGKIESFMQDPAAFNKIVHAAELFAGARVAGGVVEAGFGAMSSLGPMMSGLGAVGGEAGAAAGLGEVAAIAGPAALAIAALAAGAWGAIDILTDSTALFHDWAVSQVGDMVLLTKDLSTEFGNLGHTLKPLAWILGADLIGAAKVLIWTLDTVVTGLNGLFAAAQAFTDFTASLLGLHRGLKEDPIEVARIASVAGHVIAMDAKAEPEKDRKPPTHVTNIGHVEIKVNSNQDPNRIAKLTADIVSDLARHPKVAQLTGAPTFTRLGF